MIISARSNGSFISFKDYSGVLLNLGPGFLVETLDMAGYRCTEQHSESAKNGHLNI